VSSTCALIGVHACLGAVLYFNEANLCQCRISCAGSTADHSSGIVAPKQRYGLDDVL
jgi:hypothetical protein